MSITVKNNYVKKSARKVRLVANLVRNKPVSHALKTLRFCEKQEIAIYLTKLINSGLDIASKNSSINLDKLVVNTITVDEGPTMKRIMPRAQGRAFKINKRTSYVTVNLKEA